MRYKVAKVLTFYGFTKRKGNFSIFGIEILEAPGGGSAWASLAY